MSKIVKCIGNYIHLLDTFGINVTAIVQPNFDPTIWMIWLFEVEYSLTVIRLNYFLLNTCIYY